MRTCNKTNCRNEAAPLMTSCPDHATPCAVLMLAERCAKAEAEAVRLRAHPKGALLDLVESEIDRATERHGPMRGRHEGYAVLLEEMDELWTEVKKGGTSPVDEECLKKEAVQVAAMALRFLHDVCGVSR